MRSPIQMMSDLELSQAIIATEATQTQLEWQQPSDTRSFALASAKAYLLALNAQLKKRGGIAVEIGQTTIPDAPNVISYLKFKERREARGR